MTTSCSTACACGSSISWQHQHVELRGRVRVVLQLVARSCAAAPPASRGPGGAGCARPPRGCRPARRGRPGSACPTPAARPASRGRRRTRAPAAAAPPGAPAGRPRDRPTTHVDQRPLGATGDRPVEHPPQHGRVGPPRLVAAQQLQRAPRPAGRRRAPRAARPALKASSLASRSATSGSASSVPTRVSTSADRSCSTTTSRVRKWSVTNSPSLVASSSFLRGTRAVCGIGSPSRPLEQRGHREPVGQPTDHRRLGAGPQPRPSRARPRRA